MKKAEKAKELFNEGYNCAQAVFCAFADEMNIDLPTAKKLSSSFGGGMGGLREVCGAVSGMFMVLGALYGYDSPTDHGAKTLHYARIREAAENFKEKNGSIICRELLSGIRHSENPQKRDAEYYKKRPCPDIVFECAKIIEEYEANN